ncbi:shikimate dehydrogenase family protein [Salinimicrobium soli]|uniref:shikimate dehydrogenase family protein n=1 Tax=Salinimicrobium soli TaxID=1254399 RepID=UPI003AB08E1F
MIKFGLIGRNISYSFSRNYFREKFSRESIAATYENFDLQSLDEFPEVLRNNRELKGLNVTIPYKEEIMPFLDLIDPVAKEIGAVNTIQIDPEGKLTGYNTDHFGFKKALQQYLRSQHQKALILGTGGASKAVAYALSSLGITFTYVSRAGGEERLTYEQLDERVLKEHQLIINCTPLGTFPNTSEYPQLPVQLLTPAHLIFDLIYNPPVTKLMELAKLQGATVVNGQKMLEFQAEKAWEIWNRS